MSTLLQVSYNNKAVLPMRPEHPTKSYSSSDVPHGTNSVIYRAACELISMGAQLQVPLPVFTQEEIDQLVEQEMENIQVYKREELDSLIQQNPAILDTNFVLEPTEEEMAAFHYLPMLLSEEDRKAAVINEKKRELAKMIVQKKIQDCLLVPNLSEEFKAQFQLTEFDPENPHQMQSNPEPEN